MDLIMQNLSSIGLLILTSIVVIVTTYLKGALTRLTKTLEDSLQDRKISKAELEKIKQSILPINVEKAIKKNYSAEKKISSAEKE